MSEREGLIQEGILIERIKEKENISKQCISFFLSTLRKHDWDLEKSVAVACRNKPKTRRHISADSIGYIMKTITKEFAGMGNYGSSSSTGTRTNSARKIKERRESSSSRAESEKESSSKTLVDNEALSSSAKSNVADESVEHLISSIGKGNSISNTEAAAQAVKPDPADQNTQETEDNCPPRAQRKRTAVCKIAVSEKRRRTRSTARVSPCPTRVLTAVDQVSPVLIDSDSEDDETRPAGKPCSPVLDGESSSPVMERKPTSTLHARDPSSPVPFGVPSSPALAEESSSPVVNGQPSSPLPPEEQPCPVPGAEPSSPVPAGEQLSPLAVAEPSSPVHAVHLFAKDSTVTELFNLMRILPVVSENFELSRSALIVRFVELMSDRNRLTDATGTDPSHHVATQLMDTDRAVEISARVDTLLAQLDSYLVEPSRDPQELSIAWSCPPGLTHRERTKLKLKWVHFSTVMESIRDLFQAGPLSLETAESASEMIEFDLVSGPYDYSENPKAKALLDVLQSVVTGIRELHSENTERKGYYEITLVRELIKEMEGQAKSLREREAEAQLREISVLNRIGQTEELLRVLSEIHNRISSERERLEVELEQAKMNGLTVCSYRSEMEGRIDSTLKRLREIDEFYKDNVKIREQITKQVSLVVGSKIEQVTTD